MMVSVYCRCIINVLCLHFAQKPFSTLSRDAYSINSSVIQERLSVSTKPHEFKISKEFDWIRNPFLDLSVINYYNFKLCEEEEEASLSSDRTLKLNYARLPLDAF